MFLMKYTPGERGDLRLIARACACPGLDQTPKRNRDDVIDKCMCVCLYCIVCVVCTVCGVCVYIQYCVSVCVCRVVCVYITNTA